MKMFKIILGGLLLALQVQGAMAGEVNAAVAANFTEPMRQIVAAFEKDTGNTVKLSFGSSGKFYSQIKEGAPFDIFLAADVKNPKLLQKEGLAVEGSDFIYAMGKLVLWSAQPGFVDEQGHVLRKGNYSKIAYADPKLAPYGQAAKETLEDMNLWSVLQGKLVTGESIAQTYQFAASGNAEMAFVALSQITKDGKVSSGSYWQIPAHMYNPIRQGAVLLANAKDNDAAKALLAYLKGDKAKAIITTFGYGLPQ